MCLCLPDWLAHTALLCCLAIGQTVPWCLRAAYVTTKTRWIPTGADTSSNKAKLKKASWTHGLKRGSQTVRFLYSCISLAFCVFLIPPPSSPPLVWLSPVCCRKEVGDFGGGNGGRAEGAGLQKSEDSERCLILWKGKHQHHTFSFRAWTCDMKPA